ncbi:trypsin-like serine protease [Streptomyces sp. 1331.2]|uniref:trypsin-like serine protease n=1 Tax=Streptomyces sp. 1331.2 TaxID=1938835 RepID=UPI000BC4CDEF|nr:trypsin-like serine protease [Streptomyces sp. 1331.2]SOB88859.1 Trypsin [Streptomyces sp. 1331.2]
MLHRTSSRPLRTGVLIAAAAAGALTTFASPAGAVVGDPVTDGSYAYTARLAIGDNLRACTGALVDPSWVITAASCLSDDPAQPQALTAGAPKWKTTATIAGKAVDVLELAPRADRDLVLARLAAPVQGVAPLALAATAPTAGEKLRVPGYGRTKDEWLPGALHAGAFGLDAVQPTTIATTGQNGAAICKGDTGAPAIRETNGKAELVAVASRSWQGGCLGTPATETRTGAQSSRVDDLAGWVQQVRANATARTASAVYDPAKQTSTVFTVDNKGRVMGAYNINGQGWSTWTPISERPAGTKPFIGSPTALYNPATAAIELFAVDSDGLMWHTYYLADAQGWRAWMGTGTTKFSGGASAVYNPSTRTAEVFATTTDGPVAHAYYTPGMTDWSPWANIYDRKFNGAPSALYNPATDAVELFAIERNSTMYHTYWFNDGKPWSDWLPLDGAAFAGSPSLVYNPSTKTAEVFATTTDGPLAHRYYTPGMTGWSNWSTINGDFRFAGAPSALYNPATDAIELFATGRNSFLYHAYWFNNGKPWSAWEALGDWRFAAGRIPTSLFSTSSNTVDVFAGGADGAVNHTSYKPGLPKWAPLDTLSGSTLPTS